MSGVAYNANTDSNVSAGPEMYFPTLLQIIKYYNIALLIGPLVLLASLRAWKAVIFSPDTGPGEHSRQIWFGVFALLLGLCFSCSIYASVFMALRSEIDLSQISEIQIERIWGRNSPPVSDNKRVVITDPNLIAEGFRLLATAEKYVPAQNREELLDGYRIRLKLIGTSEYTNAYISVYTTNTLGESRDAVVPHMGPYDLGLLHNGGEYSCPGFHEWARKNIDPLFK